MGQSDPKKEPASGSTPATPAAPDHMFVRNTKASFVVLLGPEEGTGNKRTSKRCVTAPGLNLIPRAFWDHNVESANAGGEQQNIDALELLGLVEVDPTKITTAEAVVLARTCNARNALNRWRAQEKREPVLAAIAHRLANPGKVKPSDKTVQ